MRQERLVRRAPAARVVLALLLAGSLAAVCLAPAASAGSRPVPPAAGWDASDRTNATNATRSPTIAAVYPNPVAPDDVGEFVVLDVPRATNLSEYRLADGEANVSLPDATVSGRVALSADPETARNRTELRVLGLHGDLSLSNAGETVRLVGPAGARAGRADRSPDVTYADAPAGERWNRADSGAWRWTPLGATDFPVASVGPARARTFVLPDAPGVPVETLRSADDRLLLAGYTFTSERAADALVAADRRGATVRLLVEGAPVGGISSRQAELLDSLARKGIEVRVVAGPLARYAFHHPKYAVADDRALVLTENWKPSGTGGRASRGWGVVLRSEAAADRLATVFTADAGWRDAVPWREFRRGRTFEPGGPENGSFPSHFDPRTVSVESANIVVAPDNAEESVVSLLDSARESIRVQQVSIGGPGQPFLRAARRAARRGVEVRILLSSAWYVAEDNRALAARLNERADREGIPLTARVADPRGRYKKIHAKGVVVDGDAAVVGSLNWNNNSARENREVAVVLHGEAPAGYYAAVFDRDWRASSDGAGGVGRLPVGLLAAIVVGAVVAILVARREVTFEK
ncbi:MULTISPECIES: phospholipase D-like domain-containing protein [Halorussus]|uniref:phospholipase D-like domain-containing protein n=1 Tax=Halorussus TaxID=1070314 RepID=UPI00209C94BF|nr:phospholipase D-like domain-containing protein [Halorussus vallis]USZ75528.1 phospholipase D-like domain-containing protein [Halorussus vallis]